jgi:LmbE family N-acetylglucosaminyl deacetylase
VKIHYILPHPDDESFGPAPVIAKQRRQGHEVHLLTLTRGGATKVRRKFGYSVEQMGQVRLQEMQNVARVLAFSSLTVLDFPDSGLKEVDPRELEQAVQSEIERIRPHVLVTYPVHGVSGFHDHLVSHAVVKRAYMELRDKVPSLRRLAFHTLSEAAAAASPHFRLSHSTVGEIDCIVDVEAADAEQGSRALDCYVTFQETIENSGIRRLLGQPVPFEFFQESFDPPVDDLFVNLPAT